MKKYGLQLRIPPGQKKQTPKPAAPPPAFAFKDDDDEDDIEGEISRQAAKNRALQKVEEIHQKALAEDPSVFDYDGHYDEMKEEIERPRKQDKTERESKYIGILKKKAEEREREHEIIYEKKILKERSKEDHLFADKEKFVTKAYKKKLAENAKWLEEDKLRQIREEKDDVTKKDMSEFYFHLHKNEALGARSGESAANPSKHKGASSDTQKTGGESRSAIHPPTSQKVHAQTEEQRPHHSERQDGTAVSTSELPVEDASPRESKQKRSSSEEVPKTEQQPPKPVAEVYKRSEDVLAAATERYLARKKARGQL